MSSGHPVSGLALSSDALGAGSTAFGNESIRVPVMEKDVEIRKVARPVEEIEIQKSQTQDTRHVEGTIRREELDIDDRTASKPQSKR